MTTVPARAYPMRYGGGLFLCVVGAAIALGALLGGGALAPLLAAGFCLGVLCIVAVRSRVAARFGPPTRRDMGLMFAAVAFELAAFVALSVCASNGILPDTAQFIWPAVLFIVALHFLLMVWSFGAWVFYLGIAILVWLALAWLKHLDLGVILLGDGVLKMGFGAVMAAPLFRQPSTGLDAT